MEALLQDIRFAVRVFTRRPFFFSVVIGAIAMGIGANTAIFSVVNTILLRPFPYSDPDRLVRVRAQEPQRGSETLDSSFLDYLDWREQNRSFEDMAAYLTFDLNLAGDGKPEPVTTTFASASLFQTLGVSPALGRAFSPEEDRPGGDRYKVIISYDLWQRRFGADPNALNRKIMLDSESYMIVGVMPPGFRFPFQSSAWAPLDRWADRKSRGYRTFSVVARLKPDVSIGQTRADMEGISRRLEQLYPVTNLGVRASVDPLRDVEVGDIRPFLLMLLAAVGFVLLIACANLANLMLARGAAREKEMAVRAALGASRGRLVRQLITESALLAITGGLAGVALAIAAIKMLVRFIPVELPFWMEFQMDSRVLFFAIAASLLTGVLFGLVPALQVSKVKLNESLKEAGRGSSGGPSHRIRGAFVIAEVSLSLVLLIGAGLMIRSLFRLQNVYPGFRPENVLSVYLSVPYDKYPDVATTSAFYDRIIELVRALPGVEAASGITALPLAGKESNDKARFTIEGQSAEDQSSNPFANFQKIGPDYFRVMRIPLLKGRFFANSDTAQAPGVVIISDKMARRLLLDQDPIGKRLKFGGTESRAPWLTVVGVVGDVRYAGLASEPGMELYAPYAQQVAGVLTLVLRARVDPSSLVPAVQNEIWAVDKDQAIFKVETMQQSISKSIWQRRAWGFLLGIFAGLALILAFIGVYGVISYSVSQRTREIGIRRALGAGGADVLKLVLKEGLKLSLVGVVIGLIAAFALARLLESLLYGIKATDPITFIFTPLLLTAVALTASFIPAARAVKIDPMKALRYE